MAGAFSLATRVTLNNGLTMPQIQLGVYLMSSAEASQAVKSALDAGYRAIDSAQMYHNERDISTTPPKLASNSTYDRARASIRKSVKECGLGYIDLFLLHSPYGGKHARLESWRAVEDAIQDGEVRIGGVSNFGEKHITELLTSHPRIHPAVNQIEVHPFNTHDPLTTLCATHSIQIEAYAPLARALRMTHPTIVALAKKYACTPAQLLVRWSCQKGFVSLPKSVRKERIEENANVGGFEIEEGDMGVLGGWMRGLLLKLEGIECGGRVANGKNKKRRVQDGRKHG
ncbi:hypothetical protein BTJ68_11052 [Hortaea werneckii EXF-2000]|uniref:NADP-dependent oxidoreductase domain-containing protein n=1 Tax=Hortaea werneckii EXF-2000 TaxID=1157616 RepID=A0A1Z5SV84_HORWE|nr:hypothetical protein BTJ68_11052 [Hortaea werneckii EXF-2000]